MTVLNQIRIFMMEMPADSMHVILARYPITMTYSLGPREAAPVVKFSFTEYFGG